MFNHVPALMWTVILGLRSQTLVLTSSGFFLQKEKWNEKNLDLQKSISDVWTKVMEQVFPLFSPQAEKNVDIKILHLQITFDCFFRLQSPGTLWGKVSHVLCQRSHSLAVRVVACRAIGPAFCTSSPQRLFSPPVKGGRKKHRTSRSKIVHCQLTQIDLKD